MFGIIFISCLSKGELKTHQKVSNWLVAITGTLSKSILILIDKFEDDKKDIINKDASWLFIIIGIIIYFGIILLRAYVYANLKLFMDESFISSSELLMFYGLIGTIISFIVCLISTFVECSGDYFKDYICPVSYTNDEENSNIKYFDNFILYFKTLNGEINDKINDKLGLEIFYEIIVILIGTVFFFIL